MRAAEQKPTDHRRRLAALSNHAAVFALLLAGCGDFSSDDSSGGATTGGGAGAATAGAATGGAPTGGGTPSGGATTGGATSGGDATGGATSGGAENSGGATTGGSPTGGAEMGGAEMSGAGASEQGAAQEVACPDPVPSDAACGGDVLGTWTVASCPLMVTGELDMAGFGLGCSTAQSTSGSLQVTGTWTANSDGTYTDNTTTTGDQEVELPPDCLEVSGTTTTCDRVSGPVQSSLGYASFECATNEETGGCTCSGAIDQEGGLAMVSIDASDSGSYTTMDTTLSFGEDAEYSYCVMENTMVLTLETMGKTGTVMGPIVLQKQ